MDDLAPQAAKESAINVAIFKMKVAAVGFMQDFWNDGDEYPSFLSFMKKPGQGSIGAQGGAPLSDTEASNKSAARRKAAAESKLWHADRIKVLEKMWGTGRVMPGSQDYWRDLTAPVGLNHEMSVLDLSAGLGGFARYVAEEYDTYVTGMETDPLFAARGMILSIAAGKSKHASVTPYDPSIYTAARKYDCVFARELFHRIIGKEAFFSAIDESLKSGGGQLIFTDFMLEPADRKKPMIKKWLENTPDAAPLSLIEINKVWKGLGYDVRVTEDQTEDYKTMILTGLTKFVTFLAQEKPDKETKVIILKEIERWGLLYAALRDGLRYYRVNAIKR